MLAEEPERVVAPHAEQAANYPGVVVMVDVEACLTGRMAAHRAAVSLCCQALRVLGLCQPELLLEVVLTVLADVALVGALVGLVAFGIVALPLDAAGDGFLAVRLIPAATSGRLAELARGAFPVAPALLVVEVGEWLHLAALLAPLHAPSVKPGCDTLVART